MVCKDKNNLAKTFNVSRNFLQKYTFFQQNRSLVAFLFIDRPMFQAFIILCFAEHNIGGGTTGIQLGFHEVHIGGDVGKKLTVATA